MKIKPLADRVVIKPSPAEEKSKGGIILPDTAKEKPVVGEVVAIGPGKVTDDGKIREGKTVFGAIGIGNTKMKVQREAVASLFCRNDLVLDFKEIYRIAVKLCG